MVYGGTTNRGYVSRMVETYAENETEGLALLDDKVKQAWEEILREAEYETPSEANNIETKVIRKNIHDSYNKA